MNIDSTLLLALVLCCGPAFAQDEVETSRKELQASVEKPATPPTNRTTTKCGGETYFAGENSTIKSVAVSYECPGPLDFHDRTLCCGSYEEGACCRPAQEGLTPTERTSLVIGVCVLFVLIIIAAIVITCLCWNKCPNCCLFKLFKPYRGEPISFNVAATKSEKNVAMKNMSKLPETPDRAQYKQLSNTDVVENTNYTDAEGKKDEEEQPASSETATVTVDT